MRLHIFRNGFQILCISFPNIFSVVVQKTADPPGFWGETAAAGGEDGSGDWKSGSRT